MNNLCHRRLIWWFSNKVIPCTYKQKQKVSSRVVVKTKLHLKNCTLFLDVTNRAARARQAGPKLVPSDVYFTISRYQKGCSPLSSALGPPAPRPGRPRPGTWWTQALKPTVAPEAPGNGPRSNGPLPGHTSTWTGPVSLVPQKKDGTSCLLFAFDTWDYLYNLVC